MMEFDLQTRDPETNQPRSSKKAIDPRRTAVLSVDPWNYHWCMTCCHRMGSLVPRYNRALACARQLGMTVIWAPTDVVGSYAGTPQRERAMALPPIPLPQRREAPRVHFTAVRGACLCGPGYACHANYGHDAMAPDLVIAPDDWIISSTEEAYAILHRRGIATVLYLGGATNICLYEKPAALKHLYPTGIDCFLARDISDAYTSYDPVAGFTPDDGTRQTEADIERAGIATFHFGDELSKAGLWDKNWLVESVRVAPWGKPQRPYVFDDTVTVTLTAPPSAEADIRYTLDGSEPTVHSDRYDTPLTVSKTTTLRTAAFHGSKRISLESEAYYVALPPVPPKPDVYLDDLTPIPDPYTRVSPVHAACLWLPRVGVSYEGLPLRVRQVPYGRGLGMRAPSNTGFDVRPEFVRFVALAGVADNMLDHELGRNLAMHPAVIFKVFIDGTLAAESPVIRISQEPWRFDVTIPPGSRYMSLAVQDTGSHHLLNYANWVDAGFVTR